MIRDLMGSKKISIDPQSQGLGDAFKTGGAYGTCGT